ncbi:MAG: sigma-54 dependent transcriptional regulator [Bacteroidota bacterium]
MALRVALVDDDPDYARLLALHLRRMPDLDVETVTYGSGAAFLAALDAGDVPDLGFLDVVMPEVDGIETLRRARATHPDLPLVVLSAQTTVRVALDAIELGAHDYLVKGDDLGRVGRVVQREAERRTLVGELDALRARLGETPQDPRIIGESEAMARVYRMVAKAVRGDLATAVVGESGTGKELVAEAIHAGSARRDGPFVVVNCAAIPAELMESELFGHEKGSFTGAHARRAGVFEQADGGTLFLDEIGELPLGLQAKLLRVLQDRRVRRVGGTEAFSVDVRVISATHRDVPQMIRDGTFREDLYYRLFQFPIALPPLRDRGADVLLLADHFLEAAIERHPDLAPRRLTSAARQALARYRWPGNVRELGATVERAVLLADGEDITPADLLLGDALAEETRPADLATAAASPDEIVPIDTLKRLALEHAWRLCDGNADRTAARLGVTRSTVYRLVKTYGLAGAS